MKKLLIMLALAAANTASAQDGGSCVYYISHEDGAVAAGIFDAARHMAEGYGQKPTAIQPVQVEADGLYHASFTYLDKDCGVKTAALQN